MIILHTIRKKYASIPLALAITVVDSALSVLSIPVFYHKGAPVFRNYRKLIITKPRFANSWCPAGDETDRVRLPIPWARESDYADLPLQHTICM